MVRRSSLYSALLESSLAGNSSPATLASLVLPLPTSVQWLLVPLTGPIMAFSSSGGWVWMNDFLNCCGKPGLPACPGLPISFVPSPLLLYPAN